MDAEEIKKNANSLLPLALAGVAAYKLLHKEEGSLEKFLSDPTRLVVVIIGLLGFVYFGDVNKTDADISTNRASIEKIQEAQNKMLIVLGDLQSNQKTLNMQVEKVSDSVDQLNRRTTMLEAKMGMAQPAQTAPTVIIGGGDKQ